MTNSRFASFAILALTFSSPASAQAPGVPIESHSPREQDELIIARAEKLRAEGKLTLNIEAAKSQLESPLPARVEFPKPRTKPLVGREIARMAREAHISFGWYFVYKNSEKWQLGFCGAYAVAKDTIATCHHCVIPSYIDSMREGFLIAVDHRGEVLPVTSILASSEAADGAFLRVERGMYSALLHFNVEVEPGDAVYCFSAPFDQMGYFSNGIINRFYWSGAAGQNGAPDQYQNLRVNVSTDWAQGSSGAAVLDQAGNAIGHVSCIFPLNKASSLSKDKKRVAIFDKKPVLITFHEATSARAMLELAKPLRDFRPGAIVEKKTPEPKVEVSE